MKHSCLLFFFLFGLFSAKSMALDILSSQDSVDLATWQEFLRKQPQFTAATDFFIQQEQNRTLGIDGFIDDSQRLLNGELNFEEFQNRLLLTKRIAFGSSHRQIWINTLEKLTSNSDIKEKKQIQLEQQFQFEMIEPDSKNRLSLESKKKWAPFLAEWKDFPIVVIDGVEMEVDKLRLLKNHPRELRYYFVSPEFQPIAFTGTPNELLLQKPVRNKLTAMANLDSDQDHWYTLDPAGQALAMGAKGIPAGSWWERNSNWALPVLLVVVAASAYQLKDQQVEVEMPIF